MTGHELNYILFRHGSGEKYSEYMADDNGESNKEAVNYITEVPEYMQEFVRSRVLHYIGQAKCFSTVIEQCVGQDTAKLVLHLGGTTRGKN